MFNYELKFLTSDENLYLKNGDFKSYKYETKKRSEESVYDTGKRAYCERRGGFWRAPRLRQLRQLESKLREKSIVYCDWAANESLITIVFSSGAIAYLSIKPETLDVAQILFDRYCVGKLASQNAVNVMLCKSHLLFTHAERTATLISFSKSATTQPCRISDRDPHVQTIELGGSSRRSERHVSWCECAAGTRALVWCSNAAEPAPWTPAVEDRANLHLYQFLGPQVTLVAYHQLENDTISAELSQKHNNVIHILEQNAAHKTGVSLFWIRFEVPTSEDRTIKLSSLKENVTNISLPAPVRVVRRSTCDSKLLISCIDGTLHVAHQAVGLTNTTRAGFVATDVRWAGDVILATEEGGRMQCYDRALSLLNHHTKCLDFATYVRRLASLTFCNLGFLLKIGTFQTYRDTRRLQILANKSFRCGPLVLVSFTGGPLALIRIMHPRLLTAWIRTGWVSNAVSLLRALDWETDGTEGLWAVNRIVCDALRTGLQGGTGESAAQAALGAYLAPVAPHGPQAERLAPALHDLARKFFHHLLRRGRLEKAMSLAVDLADWDLFADARWAASKVENRALAEEAAALAAHYADLQDTDCSDTCSQCSSQSYSGSEAETSASSDLVRTIPPPLPRVPLPNNTRNSPAPTIMPVPITQNEPISTNSIRPNLHQYLERDNTIWNTAVRDDTHITNGFEIKPILSTQNTRWYSMDNVLSYRNSSKHNLLPINEGSSKNTLIHDDKMTPAHFRHLLQTELREDVPNTLYRYQNSSIYLPGPSLNRPHRYDTDISEKILNKAGEKNKVKFSDTVTIAVVPDSQQASCPSPSRELAASLPLCPPHKYLTAFTPQSRAPPPPPAAPGTGAALDYVEV